MYTVDLIIALQSDSCCNLPTVKAVIQICSIQINTFDMSILCGLGITNSKYCIVQNSDGGNFDGY